METQTGQRSCAVTRQVQTEALLLRFVRGPDGLVVPDLKRKLPGRGVWVGLNRERVAQAVARGVFFRGFGEKTLAPPNLPDIVASLLRQQALSFLSLARKAGQAVSGYDKVEELLRRGEVRLLLHAREAAADGRRKLDRLTGPDIPSLSHFGMAEMDLAFGRANVVHAAVKKGRLADQLVLAVERDRLYEAPAVPDKE